MELTVRITQDTISRDIDRLSRELSAGMRRQMMAEIGREFVNITKQNFGVNGPHRPAYWPSLKPSYQKRIKYSGPPQLLGRGGRDSTLRDSIQIGYVTDNSVTVETNVEYAAVHQFGGGNNIPARPYFPVMSNVYGEFELTPYAQERVNAILNLHLRSS